VTPPGVVAIAPQSASDLVAALSAAGGELETDARRLRRLLLEAGRPSAAPALIEDVCRWAHRLAVELDERIDRVVRLDAAVMLGTAPEVERFLDVRGIDDLDGLLAALASLGVLPSCPRPDDVAARRTALATLPSGLLERLAEQVPEAIGHGDGVPFAARDHANRILLRRHIHRLEARADELSVADRRLLIDLRSWRDAADLQVVKLDAARGRVVLARGDLDTASHVAAIVPGAGLTIHGISRRHEAWMHHLHDAMAARLAASDQPGVPATVLWLDYDSPARLVPSAVRRGAATDAARRLPGFLDGVAGGRPRLVTVLGHSYGSVVVGRSLADHPGRLAADQLVALGSPGLGVQLSRELDLRDDQRLLAATFEEDPIAHVGQWSPLTGDTGRAIHGPDPRRLRVAEPIELSTHDLPDAGPLERHLQYLEEGSSALRLLADLAAGAGRAPSDG
jgi:hypothetical protein